MRRKQEHGRENKHEWRGMTTEQTQYSPTAGQMQYKHKPSTLQTLYTQNDTSQTQCK